MLNILPFFIYFFKYAICYNKKFSMLMHYFITKLLFFDERFAVKVQAGENLKPLLSQRMTCLKLTRLDSGRQNLIIHILRNLTWWISSLEVYLWLLGNCNDMKSFLYCKTCYRKDRLFFGCEVSPYSSIILKHFIWSQGAERTTLRIETWLVDGPE